MCYLETAALNFVLTHITDFVKSKGKSMLRIGAFLVGLLLIGCEQRTDFDACVEYYTKQVKEDHSISLKAKKSVTEFYINEQCGLRK